MSTSNPHPTPDPGAYDRDAALVFNAITQALVARERFVALSDRSVATVAVLAALDLPTRDARIRAEVAEEIARAIEAEKPSVNRFWDTADAARVYALNDAAKLARKHAGKGFPSSTEPSVVSAEGSGHPQPGRVDVSALGIPGLTDEERDAFLVEVESEPFDESRVARRMDRWTGGES
ncbi:hypothetical protein ABGB07_02195 [Micromonosporaceae bacterium B7E4]